MTVGRRWSNFQKWVAWSGLVIIGCLFAFVRYCITQFYQCRAIDDAPVFQERGDSTRYADKAYLVGIPVKKGRVVDGAPGQEGADGS